MRVYAFASLLTCLVTLLAACSPQHPAAAPTASGDSCPLVSAGPPAVCPDGCRWNGAECRKDSGIIIYGTTQNPNQPKPPPPPPPPGH
jgi:hypothetical protein